MFTIKRYRLSKTMNGLGLDLTSMTTVKRLLTYQMRAMPINLPINLLKKTQVTKRTPDKKT